MIFQFQYNKTAIEEFFFYVLRNCQ